MSAPAPSGRGATVLAQPDTFTLRDVLILFSWEAGAISMDDAIRTLGLTQAEVFELELEAAEQGAALVAARDGGRA